MKLIKMLNDEKWKSKAVFIQVLKISPTKALTIGDIRTRCKLLDIIEKCEGDLVLEDADRDALWKVLEEFPWSTAEGGLLQILEAVEHAKKAPEGMQVLKVVE